MNYIENYFKKASDDDVLFESVTVSSAIDDYMVSFHCYVKVLCSDAERTRLIAKCKHKTIDELLMVSRTNAQIAMTTLGIN
ncbi:hypothetical protein E2R68_02295 [Psychromonas sp. RZ22]|uniref:hypothetical protein n=1 Tax=Psychromonas algarum TaxID=2555643 RepID=UPI00106866D5|nr:hypothetical protein [Psychromonas sp. RZ22]TEW55942.1 hypothetical protein E2R68_02295 [Psychromonas sp. RZ22]